MRQDCDKITPDMFDGCSIDRLADDVFQWASSVFPDRTDSSMFIKMFEELAEVIRSNGDHLEVADLFIMLLDYAKRKEMDIEMAIRVKLQINSTRQWRVNANGTMSHYNPEE